MRRTLKGWMPLLLCLPLFVCSCKSGGSSERAQTANSVYYNRYNIHYYTKGSTTAASYANYVNCPGHGFLPYNSKLKVSPWRRGLKLVAEDTGLEILLEYNSANMQGMTQQDYIDLIMSHAPVSYTNLTGDDQEGIKTGTVKVGMTKQGVMVALGYPAKHRTPSTDLNSWVYWKGRLTTTRVDFDSSGKVASVE